MTERRAFPSQEDEEASKPLVGQGMHTDASIALRRVTAPEGGHSTSFDGAAAGEETPETPVKRSA